jgi:hypothetical protein
MSQEGIISAILAVLLTFVGIWYSKKVRDKHSLTLIDDEWISLLSTFQGKFETLKVNFNQLPTTTNLYYYRASIINTGTVDIDKSRMYAPLEIALPKSCTVKECKLVNQSSDRLSVVESTNANKIFFEWDLLKPNEYFSFESIIESTEGHSNEDIIVHQRIADLKDVKKLDGWTVEEHSLGKFIRKNFFGYLALLFFLGISFVGLYHGIQSFINPDVKIESQVLHQLDRTPIVFKPFNKYKVIMNHGKQIDTIAVSDVPKAIFLNPMVSLEKDQYFLTILTLAFFLLFGVVIISVIKENIREYQQIKLMRILRTHE